jgi:hypothetical protein
MAFSLEAACHSLVIVLGGSGAIYHQKRTNCAQNDQKGQSLHQSRVNVNILTVGPNNRPKDSSSCNDSQYTNCDLIRFSRFGGGYSCAVWSECNIIC